MQEDKKVLNLIMRKKFALEILKGEKVREYRAGTMHWARILGNINKDNGKTVDSLKHFDVVHCYPYNNKWFLDVEVSGHLGFAPYGAEFEEHYPNEYEGTEGNWVFIIPLGKVLNTNLTLE